jgi:lipoprotein-releasing system permease protein
MTFSWFIAKRYLQATRKSGFVSFITGFSILGVTIGTAAVIVALSIISGFENEIKEKVFSFTSHVQVVGFQNLPLREYEQSLHIIKERIPDVVAIAPFVAKEAMIRAGDKVDGVLLKGIDPNNDLITVRGYLVEGRYLKGNQGEVRGQRPEVSELVIGGKLAAKLGVSIGDKVVLFGLPRLSRSEAETLHPRAIMFQVVGIFESGMAEYDDIYVYSTLNDAQRLFQLGNTIHGFDIIASDLTRASSVGSEIQKLLGYPHYARTAAQLYRDLSGIDHHCGSGEYYRCSSDARAGKGTRYRRAEIGRCSAVGYPYNFSSSGDGHRRHRYFPRQRPCVCVVLGPGNVQAAFLAVGYLFHEHGPDSHKT